MQHGALKGPEGTKCGIDPSRETSRLHDYRWSERWRERERERERNRWFVNYM